MPDVPVHLGARYLFTIGHSSHPVEVFLDLLRKHDIEVLVDVRSNPYSRVVSHFDSPALKDALSRTHVKYLYLGRELGGRPENPEFYDDRGHVLYFRVAESVLFQEGIERLEAGIAKYRVAIMCSEENPTGCHRRLLIGRVLTSDGYVLHHIRADGRLEVEEVVSSEPGVDGCTQRELFEAAEASRWKSIRSISPKGQRRNSSVR